MSIEQLKSINERKLETRARAYGRRAQNTRIGLEGIWVEGYKEALKDVRKCIDGAGPVDAEIVAMLIQWLEEQP